MFFSKKPVFNALAGNLCIGRGIPVKQIHQSLPNIVDLCLSDDNRQRMWLTCGTTGSGKTKLLEHCVDYDIKTGNNVCVLDPKGDESLFCKILQAAEEAGRMDDVMFLSPIFPDISIKLNPFSHWYQPEEMVQHIVSGIPPSKEPFFTQVAREVSLVAVYSHIFLKEKHGLSPTLTIKELRNIVSRNALLNIQEQLKAFVGDPKVDDIYTTLQQVTDSPPDYFNKVTSSLRTVLSQLSVGSVGAVVGCEHENPFITRLEKGQKVILMVHTGSLLFRDPALTLARVFVSMLQALVGRFYASQRRFSPPLMIYLDEFASVCYPGIESLFNKSRGAGVAIHALTQSIADLNDVMGEFGARIILDNCNTKLFFKVNDPITSKYVSSMIGQDRAPGNILNIGGAITSRQTKENIIEESAAIRLKPRQFFFFSQHSAYRGRTVDVAPPTLEVTWPIPLGAEEYIHGDSSTPEV